MSDSKALSYCGNLTRIHDHNRYLCTLFARADLREAWFAIFAFNHEIAHIARTVSEEMVGFVRYAWWRETLVAIFGGAPPLGHPVAEALAPIVTQYSLPKKAFDAIIDAHEIALAEKQELDKAFIEATSGSLMQLCAEAAALAPDAAITALGTAFAAVEAANLRSMDADHRGHFITLAREQLALAGDVPPDLRAFAHATRFYLKRLKKGRNGPAPLMLALTLWRKSLLG